ncbi:rhodanese-like domain-containing protein [Scopulibacillus cellulosilyticus]|uniref:Rhodanese-like domain-containing protein n=1 Tax=Scopulibacillus cellulosilyticus TaxID=2665665 RepID=A0ABW2PW40_9BACL
MSFIIFVLLLVGIYFAWQRLISKRTHVKQISFEQIDQKNHCVIDIRDFITSHHKPINEARNIPLSYLKRKARYQTLCKKRIVFITDDQRAAKIAARIIEKSGKHDHPDYFFTVV